MKDKMEKLGKLLFSIFFNVQRKKKIKAGFIKSGYTGIPYSAFGKWFVISWILTFIWYIYLLFSSSLTDYGYIFIILTFALIVTFFELILLFCSYVGLRIYLEMAAYARTTSIEQNLPLFLREFATNLKSGREFVDALEDSMSPQLGALNEDIQRIVVDIRSGIMTEKVLKEYADRYESYAINETFEIILDAYTGGGGMAEIIDKIAENLEVIHYLQKSAIASVANYIVFTTIVSLIIAPILFALSYNLLWLIKTLLNRLVVTGSSPSYLNLTQRLDISWSHFRIFSRIGISIISGSAAAIIGIIRKGSLKGSPVLIIIFILLSLIAYEVAYVVLKWLFAILFQLS